MYLNRRMAVFFCAAHWGYLYSKNPKVFQKNAVNISVSKNKTKNRVYKRGSGNTKNIELVVMR